MVWNKQRSIAAAVTLWVAAAAWPQQPFSLDTTFHAHFNSWYVNTALPLEDGHVLISGQIKFASDLSFRGGAYLNADGSWDMSYPNVLDMNGKLVRWNDKIYAADGGIVDRLLLDGTRDTSFILMYNGPYFSPFQGGDYHVYPDGRLVMSGYHTLSDSVRGFVGNYQFIWFSNTGYLDTTAHHRRGNGAMYQFTQMPNGQFVCCGNFTQFDGHPVDKIFRVQADGAVDTTFHTGIAWAYAFDYLPLADGRVYAGGIFVGVPQPADSTQLVRLLPDGSLDPSFSIPQFAPEPGLTVPYPTVHGIYPWNNGQLIVYGAFASVNGQPRGGICMLDSTGAVLDAFTDCSVGPYTYPGGSTYQTIVGFTPDLDSTHYYICGAYNGYTDGTLNDPQQRFVTRLFMGDTSTGVPAYAKASAGDAGVLLYPNPATSAVTVELAQAPAHGTLVLRDALGREVLRKRVGAQRIELSLAGRSAGVYVVELQDASTTVSSKRLIVQP